MGPPLPTRSWGWRTYTYQPSWNPLVQAVFWQDSRGEVHDVWGTCRFETADLRLVVFVGYPVFPFPSQNSIFRNLQITSVSPSQELFPQHFRPKFPKNQPAMTFQVLEVLKSSRFNDMETCQQALEWMLTVQPLQAQRHSKQRTHPKSHRFRFADRNSSQFQRCTRDQASIAATFLCVTKHLLSLKLTAKATENRPSQNPRRKFIFQPPIFRCFCR